MKKSSKLTYDDIAKKSGIPLSTVQKALEQIEEKDYDAYLLSQGIAKDNIHHYGFAFEGKRVLIG